MPNLTNIPALDVVIGLAFVYFLLSLVLSSVTEALSPSPRPDIPRIPAAPITGAAPLVAVRPPRSEGQRAFAAATSAFAGAQGPGALQKYPEIAHWLAAAGPAGGAGA